MKSLIILSCLFSFALFGGITNARKDPGEYWQGVKKDEPMPELIQGLVDVSKITSMLSTKENHCDTKIGSTDFEPRPNVSSYSDDSELKERKDYAKDFEPRPNVSSYNDDSNLKERKDYTKDFEPRPNVSAYNDDILKKTHFTKDFEPRPSATGYTDEDKLKEDESLVKDFEPRPTISAYSDDVVREETN